MGSNSTVIVTKATAAPVGSGKPVLQPPKTKKG